jgi:predicted amidohydrolase
MKFKIGVVQMQGDIVDVEKTLKKVESYIEKASKKADLIVFPEYIISWNLVDTKNKFRTHLQELAKKYKIDIVTGSMLATYRKKVYNTIYYIDSKGKIKGTYRKVNLWHPERPHVEFGKKVCVFNSKFGKIGLSICWDLVFPELYRKMVRKGAEIIICSAFWSDQDASSVGLKHNPQAEKVLIDACCISRSCENELIHVFCNSAGILKEEKKKWTLSGHSQITIPFKGVIKKLDHNREQMFIQEIDTAILKDAEKAYKIRKDLKKRVLY